MSSLLYVFCNESMSVICELKDYIRYFNTAHSSSHSFISSHSCAISFAVFHYHTTLNSCHGYDIPLLL